LLEEVPTPNHKENSHSRIHSGIPGLDQQIEGGFIFPSSILLTGTAGTGKTTFALQFLFEGTRNDEQTLFFTTLSEPIGSMLQFTGNYSFVDKNVVDKQLQFIDLASQIKQYEIHKRSGERMIDIINEKILEFNPSRVVIDSLSVIGKMVQSNYRMFLYDLMGFLRNWHATTLVTAELSEDDLARSEESYIADGILCLGLKNEEGHVNRTFRIFKMRGTNHNLDVRPMTIEKSGIVVHPEMEVY